MREQLLGKQTTEPGSGLDRPRATPEQRRPLEQLVELPRSRSHHDLGELGLLSVNRAHRMERLVRIDSDHHCHNGTPFIVDEP